MTDHDDTLDLGRFTRIDLEILAAAGMIEIIEPGTPEAVAFDQHVAAGLDAYDARLLATEGPDALTSDRALRQAALISERDPERVGFVLSAFCHTQGWNRSQLATWLGITIDQLAALAIEHRADPGYPLVNVRSCARPQHVGARLASEPQDVVGQRNCEQDLLDSGLPQDDLAEQYGADPERLAEVLGA